MSKMFKHVCRKQLLGQKNQGNDAWVGKGMYWEWDATLEVENKPMKINFASKVIMFEKTLEIKQAILLCYGKDKILTLQ
jgi:hypothetical protein